jgi:hypothetical protein
MDLLASNESESFAIEQLFAGTADVITQPITVVSGQNLVQYSVIGKITTSNKFAICNPGASDGSQIAVGILVNACNASGADTASVAYFAGDFSQTQLFWHAGFTTDLAKQRAFDGTNIAIHKLAYSAV